MTHTPHPAEELRLIDAELWRLDARRAQLLSRRGMLLHLLRTAPPPIRAPHPAAGPRPAETSRRGAQNVLLALGGALLTIAALAFTLLSWGDLGIGGRAAVLGTVTAIVLAAPVLLLRRGLTATAEALAALGLALTVLDAYAVHRAALPHLDGSGYAALASAALATIWAAYGHLLPLLRGPRPAAVLAAQLPLPLAALAAGSGPATVAAALLLTAALDTTAALTPSTAGPVRRTAALAAWVVGGSGALLALDLSLAAITPAAALPPALLLLLAAATATAAAWRLRVIQPSIAAGLALTAALGGLLRPAVPTAWAVPAYLACGLALLAVVRFAPPRPVRDGLLIASGLVQGAAALWTAPLVAVALLGPLTGLGDIWSAPVGPVREAVGVDLPWSAFVTVPLVLAALAAAVPFVQRAYASARPAAESARRGGTPCSSGAESPGEFEAGGARPRHGGAGGEVPANAGGHEGGTPPYRQAGLEEGAAGGETPGAARPSTLAPTALALAWTACLSLPYALPLTIAPTLALLLTLTAAGTAAGVLLERPRPTTDPHRAPATTLLLLALVTATTTALLSLTHRTATLTTLPVLLAPAVATALAARGRATRSTAACTAVATATALAAATAAAAGLTPHHTALAVLAVPAAVAVLAGRLPHPLPAMEITAGAAGVLSIGLATGHPPTLSLVLALSGVICAGTALRSDRRPLAYAATVLLVPATWVRLAASEVTVPEAYGLPVTVPALLIGYLRRRRDPAVSSWPCYGPGLAATLLPSLLAVWGDDRWQRPLLLGLAALALTLLGAHHRLQAPLVLGSAVLLLVGLHELAPYLVQVVDALPRWLPPALAGVVLLGVGATYERRLGEARSLMASLGRMD